MAPKVPVSFEDLPLIVIERADFVVAPGGDGAEQVIAHEVIAEINRIGDEFKEKARLIYGNEEEMIRKINALGNLFDEALPAIETVSLAVRVFYEHPILIFHLNQFFRLMGGIRVWFEKIGNGEYQYVIHPENIVVPIPLNADGTHRQINDQELARFQ
ncbi:hypothetical protein CAEBREN_12271 [Caenorhabditis brenneri]|uniref:Uncharacterized protein n=1 Tax=Caenorhabditis brenneri TaxID=135651 RepID=G0M7H3_CAEBE|nr:hypothetical protein CAEBREN_12271 [Caenorhabditis brenneri]